MSSEEPTGSADSGIRPGSASRWEALVRWRHRDRWLLLLVLGGYAALMTYFSYLRYANFLTTNWDLGINQQLLWSGTQGGALYEATDYSAYGAVSFLQVHSTYAAFLIVPVYGLSPTPLTLFVVQSLVFAASGVPLFYLARRVLKRSDLAFVTLALYLAAFGTVSALMYDFHWESFLPLEFLTFFVLVLREKYLLSVAPFVAGCLTLEVFPFLVVGVALYFLVERFSLLGFAGGGIFRDRTARVMGLFLVAAVAAYALLRLAEFALLPHLLGVSPHGASSATTVFLDFGVNTGSLWASIAYWGLLLAGLGLIPLLAPRQLILSVPWFYFSVFAAPSFSSDLGSQYALIAMPGLAVAFVYGLGRLVHGKGSSRYRRFLIVAFTALAFVLLAIALVPGGSPALLGHQPEMLLWVPLGGMALVALALWALDARRSRTRSVPPLETYRSVAAPRHRDPLIFVVASLFLAVLLFDAAMSPMVPQNFNATPSPGYQFRFSDNAAFGEMGWITGLLPARAEVLASDHLFPFVANDVNAWAYPWYPLTAQNALPYFPFDSGHLPKYVFVDAAEFGLLPAYLSHDLFDSSIYGLVAYVHTSGYPGTIYLFEIGHSGAPQVRSVSETHSAYYFTALNLSLGRAGVVQSLASSRFGQVIGTLPIDRAEPGNVSVWYGPYVTLMPGTYRVTFNVTGAIPSPTLGSEVVAWLNASWDSGRSGLFTIAVNGSGLAGPGWHDFRYTIDLRAPYPDLEFRGYVIADRNGSLDASLTLNYVEVQLVGPA